MIREAMEYFLDQSVTKVFRIGGQDYTNKKLTMITNPPIEPIVVSSLTGLVDYLKSGEAQGLVGLKVDPSAPRTPADATNLYTNNRLFVQVVDACRVGVMTGIGSDNTRDVILKATHDQSAKFPFGSWISPEEFITQLKINAVAPPDPVTTPGVPVDGAPVIVSHYHQLLALASGIELEHIATLKDDGVSQAVAVRKGVTVDHTKVLPFYSLNFRRSFPEVHQAGSSFFLRIRSRSEGKVVELCLYEAGRDNWDLATRSNIKEWLADRLKNEESIVLLD